MKKTFLILLLALFSWSVVIIADEEVTTDGAADIQVKKRSVYFKEKSGDPSTPASGGLKLYAKDDGGTSALYFKNDAGTVTQVGSGGGASVSDTAYGPSWDGVTTVAPSKNAVYDKIETISAGSGITRTVVVTSGNVTAGASSATDYVYLVAGAHTVTMPTAVGNTNLYKIKNNHSSNITINTTASQTIDGATSISVAPEESVDLISDGSNWRIQ